MIHPPSNLIHSAWRVGRHALVLTAGLSLAGCEGTVTVDLATESQADPDTQQVLANVTGLEFRTSDGNTETLEFSEAEAVELTDYASGDPLRLFTTEDLPEGEYTGVRLLFDEEDDEIGSVIDDTGSEYPLTFAQGNYATVNFDVEDQKKSNESLTLTLDLRQSLSFDDDDDIYTLQPVLRSVRTDEAGQIRGTVDVSCSSNDSLDEVAAVYLFTGEDVTPDDRDDSGVEPYATAPVRFDGSSGTFTYSLRFLPEGKYTLALACEGNEEDPTEDDDLDFRDAVNVQLDQEETIDYEISG